jgi:hypothetical protein
VVILQSYCLISLTLLDLCTLSMDEDTLVLVYAIPIILVSQGMGSVTPDLLFYCSLYF